MKTRAFLLFFALGLAASSAAADNPLTPFPSPMTPPSAAPTNTSGFVSGTCGTTNAIAFFSAAQTLTCDADFVWTPTTNTLSFASTTSVSLANAANALNFDSNTLSIDALNNRNGMGTAAPDSTLHVVGGTLASSSTFAEHISATLPASPAGTTAGVSEEIATAGSAAQFQLGEFIQLTAGYTGSVSTEAILAFNTSASASVRDPRTTWALNGSSMFGSVGTVSFARAAGTGNRIGTINQADFGTTFNLGTYSTGVTETGMTGFATGVFGVATTDTGVSGIVGYGGYFLLTDGGLSGGTLAAASSALVADNGSAAADIFEVMDNGGIQWAFVNGGDLLPATDNNVNIGSNTFRVKLVRAVTVTTGDLVMDGHEHGGAKWRLIEADDRIVVVNEDTGERFHMVMEAE